LLLPLQDLRRQRRGKQGASKEVGNQTADSQVPTILFSEKVGIIEGQEFLITHDKEMRLQQIGKKEIILSKKS
jgi:hypothetical protein